MLEFVARRLLHTALVALGVVTLVDVMEQARYMLDAKKRRDLYTEATRIVHEDKPWLELFQEVVLYGVSKRVSLKPRADYRLLAAELTLVR